MFEFDLADVINSRGLLEKDALPLNVGVSLSSSNSMMQILGTLFFFAIKLVSCHLDSSLL